MAISQEQIETLKPEGIEENAWKSLSESFIKLHDSDIEGLKNNEMLMKKEKSDLKEKFDALKTQSETLTTQYKADLETLNKQLKENSPDSIKAIYEAKQKELSDLLESSKKTYEEQLSERDSKISVLERGVFQKDCIEEFTKAISNKNFDPSAIQEASLLVLGENCNKFKRVELETGKSLLVNESGESIAKAVETFAGTSIGKRFTLNGSQGGGAEGSNAGSSTAKKTMTKAEWAALPAGKAQADAAREYNII